MAQTEIVTGMVLLTMMWIVGAAQRGVQVTWAQPMDARSAPGPEHTLGAIPEGFGHRRDSPHFVFLWHQADPPDEDMDAVVARAERLFARLAAELGPERLPSAKLLVLFDGPWQLPTGPRYPFVDPWGRIHLVRFPGRGYLGQLGHEMVHAFRLGWWDTRQRRRGVAWGFVEEGFAELLAMRIEPDAARFPTYGFPLEVVVGQWLVTQEAPPLQTLLERHGWLNLHCLLQAYALRGSFFRYLSETFGQEAVLRLAYSDDEMTPALFAQVFGRTFDALEQEWRAWAVRAFEATADAAQLARAYRDTVKNFYRCQAGKDY